MSSPTPSGKRAAARQERSSPRRGGGRGRGRAAGPAEIRRIIRAGRSFLIVGHVRPDGDCLGAELALAAILSAAGKRARIVNQDPLPPPYAGFFPAGRFRSCRRKRGRRARPIPADVVFILDTATFDRIGEAAACLPREALVVNIDHHVSNGRFGDRFWVDPAMSSVSEMIWVLARSAARKRDRLPLPPAAAMGLYTGVATDTGQFAYSNTTARAHRMAADLIERGVRPGEINRKVYYKRHPEELELERRALGRLESRAGGRIATVSLAISDFREVGVDPSYAREFANIPRALAGVRVAIFFCEIERGGRRGSGAARVISTRTSIRTSPGIDANRIASAFGGGGHPRAAGCEIEGRLARAKRLVYAEAQRHLSRSRSGRKRR